MPRAPDIDMASQTEDKRLRGAGVLAAASIAAVIGAFVWANRVDSVRNAERIESEHQLAERRLGGGSSAPQPIGTAGRSQLAVPGPSGTIRSLQAIAIAEDARELVGRRVDLRVK